MPELLGVSQLQITPSFCGMPFPEAHILWLMVVRVYVFSGYHDDGQYVLWLLGALAKALSSCITPWHFAMPNLCQLLLYPCFDCCFQRSQPESIPALVQEHGQGTSLVVQWVKHLPCQAGNAGLIPGQGTKISCALAVTTEPVWPQQKTPKCQT